MNGDASLATVARRICSSYIDPISIKPLLVCCLIAFYKYLRVHPIGIGNTAHRIIAKAVQSLAAPDIQDASPPLLVPLQALLVLLGHGDLPLESL